MSTVDLEVGFLERPKGLEAFLRGQGYERIPRMRNSFEHKNESWPAIHYYPKALPVDEEDDAPNWKGAGFKVVSELNINYPAQHDEEADRIAQELVRRFGAVLYDPNMDAYYTQADFAPFTEEAASLEKMWKRPSVPDRK